MEENKLKLQLEELHKANDIIYGQLTFAEAKNGVLVGLLGAVIVSLLAWSFDGETQCWLAITIWCISAMLAVSLLLSVVSFIPNTKTLCPTKKNNFFWGDIAKYGGSEDYLQSFSSEQSMIDDLAQQNIQVSRIIARKNKLFRAAVYCLLLIIPFGIIIMLIQIIKRLCAPK